MLNRELILLLSLAVVAGAAFCASSARAEIVKNGLVSYWTFDKATVAGGTVKDVQGINDGTTKGDVKLAAGKFGDGLAFGGADSFVDMGNDKSLIPTDGFTVEAWFKTEQEDESLWQTVASKNSQGGDRSFEMRIQGTTETLAHVMSWAVVDASNAFLRANAPDTDVIKNDVWYHMAGTWTGKQGLLYVDGEQRGSVDCASIRISESHLFIGARPDLGNEELGARNFFKGVVDEVRLYDRALSLAEVKQNFASEGPAAVGPGGKLADSWGEIKTSK